MLNNVNISVTVNNEVQEDINFSHFVVDVTDLSTEILSENPNRKYLLIANTSDTDMYINLGGTAILGEGIPINAGGNYQMPLNYITKRKINAIHAGEGLKKLLITEGK